MGFEQGHEYAELIPRFMAGDAVYCILQDVTVDCLRRHGREIMRHCGTAVLALALCAPWLGGPASAQENTEALLVTEARSFMTAYGDDLRAGNRASIASRYDEDGAWIVHSGAAQSVTYDQIVNRYRDRWEPPAGFVWHDLTFVPVGADAITVIGRFDWTTAGGETDQMSYNGVLVRTPNGLRIRIEDEALVVEEED